MIVERLITIVKRLLNDV